MNLDRLAEHRLPIAIGVGVLILVLWYLVSYRPRQVEESRLDRRLDQLRKEEQAIADQITKARTRGREVGAVPSRVAPREASAMTETERLNYFLDNITRPANDLELEYFTVTPHPPRKAAGYQEIPFSVAIAGGYAALADYLYQLEYGRDFVVRSLGLTLADGGVRADFELAAVLLDTGLEPGSEGKQADPGPPTSLELARDPFVRPPARIAIDEQGNPYFLNVPPGLSLSGVMRTNGRMVAIINHEPFRVGATIDNKKITKIDYEGVELSDSARSYFLEMEQPPPTNRGGAEAR